MKTGHFKRALDKLTAELSGWPAFQDCRIDQAYLREMKPTRIKSPWLIVTPRGAAGALLTLGGAEKQLTIQIGLDIYLPPKQADKAGRILDEALECLFYADTLAVNRCEAGELKWDERTETLMLPAVFWLEEVIA